MEMELTSNTSTIHGREVGTYFFESTLVVMVIVPCKDWGGQYATGEGGDEKNRGEKHVVL